MQIGNLRSVPFPTFPCSFRCGRQRRALALRKRLMLPAKSGDLHLRWPPPRPGYYIASAGREVVPAVSQMKIAQELEIDTFDRYRPRNTWIGFAETKLRAEPERMTSAHETH
jgi:hypothetical protein